MSNNSKSSTSFFKNHSSILIKDKPVSGGNLTESEIIAFSINPMGNSLVLSRTDKSLRIWKFSKDWVKESLTIENAHIHPVKQISWDTNVKHLFSTVGLDNHVKIWNSNTGTLEKSVDICKSNDQIDRPMLTITKYSSDGKYIIAIDNNSIIYVLSITQNYKLVAKYKHNQNILELAWFNHEHTFFICGTSAGTLPIFELKEDCTSSSNKNNKNHSIVLRTTLKGHTSSISSINIDSKGCFFVAGSEDGVLSLWNNSSLLNTHVYTLVDEPISCVAISNDNKYIVIFYASKSILKLIDFEMNEKTIDIQNILSGKLSESYVEWFPNKNSIAYICDNGMNLTILKN